MAGAVLLGMLVAVPTAGAVNIDVNTNQDEYGGTPGACSLREAVKAAQTNSAFDGCPAGSGADVINLPDGEYKITRAGADEDADVTGDFDVTGTDSLTIQAADAQAIVTVNGNGLDRVFDQQGNNSLSIRNLNITGGVLTLIEDGGGIRNSMGTLSVEGSTIADNSSKYSAGGIAVYSSLSMVNSTVSGNSSDGNGGGLYFPASTGTVKSSTITGNTADADAEGNGEGGGFNDSGATSVNFFNVILAANRDLSPVNKSPDCYSGPNFYPRFVVSTQALGAGNCLIGFANPGNQVVADAKIGGLSYNNGGQTPTHPLLADSPARGTGGTAAPDQCPAKDQNGLDRSATSCDIGSVIYVEPPPPEANLLIDKIGPAKKKVKRGKTIKVKLTIKNGGNAGASSVKACLALKAKASKKALKIKGPKCKSLGSIAAGASKTAVIKVSAKKKAKKKAFTVVSSVKATGLSKATRPFKIKVK